jgi:hypothetical protein
MAARCAGIAWSAMTTLVSANCAIVCSTWRGGVEPGRGFVDDEDVVLGGKGAGEVDAAEFAAGQSATG